MAIRDYRFSRGVLAMFVVLLAMALAAAPAAAKGLIQLDLVSDQAGEATFTDPNLVNPWGMAFNGTGTILWVNDNGTGVSTLYRPTGEPLPLVVTIAPPAGISGPATPTGIVFNGTSDFVIERDSIARPSRFLFATEDGTISGWDPEVAATESVLAVDRFDEGAVYKGLTMASTPDGNFLYATDFGNGLVDMFDEDFVLVRSFTDPSIPSTFAPFGIKNIDGRLFVTYARKSASDPSEDQPGAGNGYVVIFDTAGDVVETLVSRGRLNSPWGLEVAPGGFGMVGRALLVGNFGDGRINAYSMSGQFLGQLQDRRGRAIVIDGLWDLLARRVVPGAAAADREDAGLSFLHFTAGPDDETHGLLGTLRQAPAWGLGRRLGLELRGLR